MKRVPVPTEAIRAMIEDVSVELDVPASDIRGPNQTKHIARARHICCVIAIDVMRAQREEIGSVLNRSVITVHQSTQAGRKLLLWDMGARLVYETVSTAYRDRFRLSLIGELELMNRMVSRYRKRAAVIAELLGVDETAKEAEAAE